MNGRRACDEAFAEVGTAESEQRGAEDQQAQQRERVMTHLAHAVPGVAQEHGARAEDRSPPRPGAR
jgi:hypothetical protein